MQKPNLPTLILFASILLSLINCKVAQISMQPDEGYPLLKNKDSISEYFTNRCIDLIHFSEGDVIADIGAGNGCLEGMLSLSYDSLTFYIQDIDSSICNPLTVDRVYRFYKNLKVNSYHHKFIAVTGTDSTTNLPDLTFDKILMINTYQYIKKPKAFILDVHTKLKEGGHFYVINPQYEKYDGLEIQREKYGWNASPLEIEITNIIHCGFELINLSRHYGIQGDPYLMVFRKK